MGPIAHVRDGFSDLARTATVIGKKLDKIFF